MPPPQASAATLAVNLDPEDPTDPHGAATVAPGATPVPEGPPPIRRRGRRRKDADGNGAAAFDAVQQPQRMVLATETMPGWATLTDDELHAIGVLTVRATRAGVPVAEYIHELRTLLAAADRMQAYLDAPSPG